MFHEGLGFSLWLSAHPAGITGSDLQKKGIVGKHGGLGSTCHHCSVSLLPIYVNMHTRKHTHTQKCPSHHLVCNIRLLTKTSWSSSLNLNKLQLRVDIGHCECESVFRLVLAVTEGSQYLCLLLHFLFLWGRFHSHRTWQLTFGGANALLWVTECVSVCVLLPVGMKSHTKGINRTCCWLRCDSTPCSHISASSFSSSSAVSD